jgi:hypothetical protein
LAFRETHRNERSRWVSLSLDPSYGATGLRLRWNDEFGAPAQAVAGG